MKLTFTRLLPRYDQSSDMSTAQNSINSAQSAGQTAINSFDPTAEGNKNLTSLTGMIGLPGTQAQQTQNFQNQYSQAIKANPQMQDLYTQANQQYGVPQQAALVAQTQNRLNNALPDQYQAIKGFDIDNSDAQNALANKSAYLEPQLQAQQNNLNAMQGLAQGYVTQGLTQNQMNLLPVQNSAQLLAQQQSAQQTGWNQNAANTLNALVSKMQSGVQLSEQEMQTAQALAATEESYNATLQTNLTSLATANIQAQAPQALTPTQRLVSGLTGNVINSALKPPTL